MMERPRNDVCGGMDAMQDAFWVRMPVAAAMMLLATTAVAEKSIRNGSPAVV